MNWMRREGLIVEGVEGTLEFVKQARRRSPQSRIIHTRFENTILPEREYDGIWCNAALIHVPPAVLREQLKKLRAALKPDGLLGLTLTWGRRKGFTQRDWIPGRYVAGYQKAEAKRLLKGWTVPEVKVLSKDGRQGRWIQIVARAPLRQTAGGTAVASPYSFRS